MTARRGLTLLELTIASAVSLVVALALGTLFVGAHRLVRQSYGVARASLDLRAERDHLLFHSSHEGGNAYWGGLLSASKVESLSPYRVRYTATGADTGSGSSMSRNGQSYPDGQVASQADEAVFETLDGTGLYAVTLTRTVGDAAARQPTVTLSARVVVPAFGVEQQRYESPGGVVDVFNDWRGE